MITSTIFNVNMPKSITNLAIWFDATRNYTISSGKISQWNDLSGNSRNATQSIAGQRPTWTDNKQKARPGIVMSYAATTNLVTAAFSLSSQVTTFLVANVDAHSTVLQYVIHRTSASGTGVPGYIVNVNDYFVAYHQMTSGTTQSNLVTNFSCVGSPILTVSQHNLDLGSAEVTLLRVNGSTNVARASDGNNTGPLGSKTLNLGLNDYPLSPSTSFNGWIGEVLIYDRLLTTAEIGYVERYLSQKWGLKMV